MKTYKFNSELIREGEIENITKTHNCAGNSCIPGFNIHLTKDREMFIASTCQNEEEFLEKHETDELPEDF